MYNLFELEVFHPLTLLLKLKTCRVPLSRIVFHAVNAYHSC